MEISKDIEAEISRARQAGLTARENELRAVAVRCDPESATIIVNLNNFNSQAEDGARKRKKRRSSDIENNQELAICWVSFLNPTY